MNNSLKSKIEYWFKFLCLAHESPDRIVQSNLKASSDRYAAWGNYTETKFNDWWKSHSSLFRDAEVLTRPEVGSVVDEDAFYVRVPFTYAPSTVGKIVADMYDREHSKRVVRTKRVKKVYGGEFRLTADDYQVAQFHYYYVFVRDVYLRLATSGRRCTARDFVDLSKKVFGALKKKTTEKRKIPFTDPEITYESESRLVRRYRQYAEKLLRNVSAGVFSGDYEETFIKNQSQLRAEKAAKKKTEIEPKKRLRGRPHSMDQKVVKRKSGLDPHSETIRRPRKDKGEKRGKYRI
jgi:hypothetical protein